MTLETYLNPTLQPISEAVLEARQKGGQDPRRFLPFERATELMNSGYHEVETGYCLSEDGSAYVAVLTDMPQVTPTMWHWWFGWHGDDSRKYKLWHPHAHISAQWQDKIVGRQEYVDRVSLIEEYIGSNVEKIAIQFKRPCRFGLPDFDDASADALHVVAVAGIPNAPIDFARMIHQVRTTPAGSEMRSRFWLGGKYISARGEKLFGKLAAPIMRRLRKIPEQFARDLLTHCAEEMSHLTTFLPKLYAEQQQ
jgi:hypothetical protein